MAIKMSKLLLFQGGDGTGPPLVCAYHCPPSSTSSTAMPLSVSFATSSRARSGAISVSSAVLAVGLGFQIHPARELDGRVGRQLLRALRQVQAVLPGI